MSAQLSVVIFSVFSFLLLSFLVTGAMLIRRLTAYFIGNYSKQRYGYCFALLLTSASLICLNARFIAEFMYAKALISLPGKSTGNPTVSLGGTIALLVLSDVLPFIS